MNNAKLWIIGGTVLLALVLIAAPQQQVILTDKTGQHRLVYSGSYTPQAKTAEDMDIVNEAAFAVADEADREGDEVTRRTLLLYRLQFNFRGMEQTVVEYRMKHPEKKP